MSRRTLRVRLRSLALVCAAALLVLGGSQMSIANADPNDASPTAKGARLRVFYSGHSLTDRPIPDDVAAIAESLGSRIDWNRQHIAGSSIRERALGLPRDDAAPGRTAGVDRNGAPIDVASEFRDPATPESSPYDVLVITEQHALLSTLLWNDTVGQLALFHDAFVARNPRGVTIFYEPWMSIDDKADPSAWIAYEAAASEVWRCAVAGVNRSLFERSRTDRIVSLPAARALASLVESAPSGGLPGAKTTRQAVNLLVSDDVHLTRLGAYYIALVLFAAIEGKPPVGSWRPEGVSAGQAAALQEFAARFVARETSIEKTLEDCAALVADSFSDVYWAYYERARWRKEVGPIAARVLRLRETARDRLRRWRGDENPFVVRLPDRFFADRR